MMMILMMIIIALIIIIYDCNLIIFRYMFLKR